MSAASIIPRGDPAGAGAGEDHPDAGGALVRQLRDLVLGLLARPGLGGAQLGLDTELASLGVDSLDHIQIAAGLHDRFGVKLPAAGPGLAGAPPAPFHSLRTLATAVQREIDGRAPEA